MEGNDKIKDEKIGSDHIGNQIVHIRDNSDSELQALFDSVLNPSSQMPLQKPFKMRNLPASFFTPPSHRQSPAPHISHSREGSADSTYSSTGTQLGASALSRQPQHFRHHSSPATLQQTLSVAPQPQHVHPKQHSFDALADELPQGWEQARTLQGQIYYLNHSTQTTTWEDPRKKTPSPAVSLTQINSPAQAAPPQPQQPLINSNTPSPNANSSCSTTPVPSPPVPMAVSPSPTTPTAAIPLVNPNLGPLPHGWEQGISREGDIYFINHADKNTSWFDPRLPRHVQTALGAKSVSPLNSNAAPPPPPTNSQLGHHRQHLLSHSGHHTSNQHAMDLIALRREKEIFRARQQEEMLRAHREFSTRGVTSQSLNEAQQRTVNALLTQHRGSAGTSQSASSLHSPLPSMNAEMTLSASSILSASQASSVDPFVSTTDIHSRQESADSGLGLGGNYTHPHTPEDFLATMDDVENSPVEDMKQPAPSPMMVVSELESMDSEDLVPSLSMNDDLSTDFLNDMLEPSKINFHTWL